ncbi:hypothetical protein KPZU09_10630 [Klebsiella pneumoniae]|uniref:NarG-like domain-containing protein n=1 Tax=Klebsiella pneumoniae TaxID=573 RepID=A0A919LXE0_KLEPN|nr:hypothetical protein KPZU09_10630 [Klebsiella pneumoniae]
MRRLTNPRIRATSTTADILILCILLIQCALGLTTIPFSAQHPDGSEMLKLVDWAQAVVTFHGGASAHLDGVAWIYRVHLVLGMTIFLIFPFTRRFTSGARRWSISPGVTGGTLPALSAGGVYHSSLPVARTRPSRQVRVFIVPAPCFMPGGGCRLTRPTGSSHRLKPRRPAQAQRRRARYQTRYL